MHMAERRVIELVEYKPVELPVGELPMKAAALLHDRYGKHVHIERVFWDGGDRWRLINLGWAGYIPLDETLAIAETYAEIGVTDLVAGEVLAPGETDTLRTRRLLAELARGRVSAT